MLFRSVLLHHFIGDLFLHVVVCLVPAAGEHPPDRPSERCVQVEEEQGVEAQVQDAQQQRRLLPQKQLPLGLAVRYDLGLSQRVRCPDDVIWDEAENVGQRHGRHTPCHPPGLDPEFRVAPAAQEPLQSQSAGDEHSSGGVEEQRRAEEDGEGMPVEADVLLQGGTAEVPLHLERQPETEALH